jgi:two-component system chemotaxis sensor kinase CheA
VVPLDIVEECVELTDSAQTETHGRHYINLRERVLPFISLRDHFGLDGVRSRRQNILVVRQGEERIGLVVDELMGEAQTVIKPLGRLFRTVKGIGGSTVLGDGRVALILDVPTLLEHVRAGSAAGQRWTVAA